MINIRRDDVIITPKKNVRDAADTPLSFKSAPCCNLSVSVNIPDPVNKGKKLQFLTLTK